MRTEVSKIMVISQITVIAVRLLFIFCFAFICYYQTAHEYMRTEDGKIMVINQITVIVVKLFFFLLVPDG